MSDKQRFGGFEKPKSNYSKLPHQFIDVLPLVDTIGEMKVILYILRHTWGYQDSEKRITLDEFEKGRKNKRGERIDSGTGLSIPTIRDGLKRAEEHGFVIIETDSSDLARVKNFYSLNIQGERNLHPGYKNLSPWVQESFTRTEKETEKETEDINGTTDVFTHYQNKIGQLTPPLSNSIQTAISVYPHEWIIKAIDLASSKKKRSWNYINGILNEWETRGVQNNLPKQNGELPQQQQEMVSRLSKIVKETFAHGITEDSFISASTALIEKGVSPEQIDDFGEWWNQNGYYEGKPAIKSVLMEFDNFANGITRQKAVDQPYLGYLPGRSS